MSAALKSSIKPQGCTSAKLRKLQRTVAVLYDAEISACGLKTTQYSLLSNIQAMQPVRPGDLAHAMRMSASTLTRNLRPLQEQGWVTVEEGEDARSRSVSLTPEGLVKRKEAQRRWRIAQDKLNEKLGLERVAALHALIDEALEMLDAPEGDEGDD